MNKARGRNLLPGLLCVLVAFSGWARAIGEVPVRFPLGSAAWTVTFRHAAVVSPGRVPKTIHVSQDESARCFRVEWTDGTRNEIWWTKAGVLEEDLQSGEIHAFRASGDLLPAVGVIDEKLFAWMRAGNFVSKLTVGGKTCLHFRAVVATAARPDVEFAAWIEESTRLPVALEAGGQRLDFAFEIPPSARLVMPERFRKKLAALNAPPPTAPAYQGRR